MQSPQIRRADLPPRAGRVVVVGSVNCDHIVAQPRLPLPGETMFGRSFATIAGGKGLNQAVAAARMGSDVAVIGPVGEDARGEELIAVLAGEGVDVTRLVVQPGAVTGTAHVSVLESGENSIVVVPGANASAGWSSADEAAVWAASVVMAQLERPLGLVRAAFDSAREHGALTVLTPAPVVPEARALFPLVDVLLLNALEARTLTGVESVRRAAEHLSRTVDLVIVTRGSRSTLVAQRGSIVAETPARRVDVVDTTGAGDCFAGALVARLVAGDSLPQALEWATLAASVSVTRRGASSSVPNWEELATLSGG